MPQKLRFRFFDLIAVVFVLTLVISNIGSTKIVGIGPFIFDAGTILFPLAYILGDAITEVYGFPRARRVIWIGFASLLFMAAILAIIQVLPAAPGWEGQEAYEQIIGFVPRIVGASMLAYLIGEMVNSILLAKLKVYTKGKFYWLRSFASSVGGQLLDTVIFSLVAFAGTMPGRDLWVLIFTVYGMKLLFEVALLPLNYWLVSMLKKKENIDVFDDRIRILPFS